MSPPRGAFCNLPVVVTLLLSACVQPPPQPEPPAAPAPRAAPPRKQEPITPSTFELRRREQAQALEQQGRWADAAAEWEVLALLRPDRAEYRAQLNEARMRIEKAVAERLQSASEARQRGDTDRAQLLYLKALSLDPDNAVAAQALRDIESERTRRTRVGRPAVVATDRPVHPKAATEPPAAAVQRRDLEYGSLLLRQGEYLASIKTFESYLKAQPKDELGRRYLAEAYFQLGQQRLQQGKKEEALLDLEKAASIRGNDAQEINSTLHSLRKSLAEDYYQQGLRVSATDISRAAAFWERAVRYDPSHVNAGARLQQARQMERNLRAIEGAGRPR